MVVFFSQHTVSILQLADVAQIFVYVICQLKDGYSVLRKKYDHNNGEFTLPFQIKSNRLVMFEGLHPFYLKSQADLYDLKVFIKPDEKIRIQDKLAG